MSTALRRPWTIADAILAMPEIGVELVLAEAYEGVEFLPEPPVSE